MKEKTVTLGGKPTKISTSGYLVILYSDLFNSNVFEDFSKIVAEVKETGKVPKKEMITLFKVTYAMAKHSDPDIPNFEDWIREIDILDIPNISDDIIDLWVDETSTQSTP